MIFFKAYLFSKFRELWKIIVPFLFFLIISLSLIIGVLSFTLNIKQNLDYVWQSGNFRNIEYSSKPFSTNKTDDKAVWSFRKNELGISFIEDFINQDQRICEINSEVKKQFLEEVGHNEGYVKDIDLTEQNNEIFNLILESKVLNLKFYNYNLIDAFVITNVFNKFQSQTNIFPIREVGTFKNITLGKNMKFHISPTNKIDNPTYLLPNSDSDLYIFDSLDKDKISALNDDYIYLTPIDLDELGLEIGDNYKFKIGNNLISTTIAGTAISKTTIPKNKNTISIYAPYSFLQKYELIQKQYYGAYINEIGDNYTEAEKYFNELLNNYFYNDDLNIYKANYTTDYKQSPYFTIYKTPIFVFSFLTLIIIFIVIFLITVMYIWISFYAIKQQSEILWTLKANGVGNWVIGLCQIIGDIIPQLLCILISIPFSILFYSFFINTVIDQYAFNLKSSSITLESISVVIGLMLLMFFIYSIINFLIISRQIKIQNSNYKTYKFINFIKKPIKNDKFKFCLLISAPNITKSSISGLLLFLIYFFISFGTLFNQSLYTSANTYRDHMAPYKNYSGQYITQNPLDETVNEIEAINFESLKSCENFQNCLEDFIETYKDKDPRTLKINGLDLEWLLKIETDNETIERHQLAVLYDLSVLWDFYKKEFYPEIYFKNFPTQQLFEFQSTFNLEFQNEIKYNIVGLENDRDIYKQYNLEDNEVALNYKSMQQFKKWGHLKKDKLSLSLDGKTYSFKVVFIDNEVIDNYYIFINKNWIIENLYNGINQRNNIFYSKYDLPLTTELLVLPTLKNGNKFSDYFSYEEQNIYKLETKVTDYNEVSKIIIENLSAFGTLAIHSSGILFLVSLNIILILISLTIISNKKIIITLKQMGYKHREIIFFIMTVYTLFGFLFLIFNYLLMIPTTSKALTMMSNMAGAKLLIGLSAYSFVIPAIIFILFLLILYISLKVYLFRVKLS